MGEYSDISKGLMVFINLKTIVFKNKKNTFQLRNFVPFIVCLLPSLFNYRPSLTISLSREADKRIGVKKSNVFIKFVITLLASTRVFLKKK